MTAAKGVPLAMLAGALLALLAGCDAQTAAPAPCTKKERPPWSQVVRDHEVNCIRTICLAAWGDCAFPSDPVENVIHECAMFRDVWFQEGCNYEEVTVADCESLAADDS
jgi:hypothetical protein